MEFQGIATALQNGCRLHAFLSGAGLRVIRLEDDGKLKGYGEHPHVDEALVHADEDFLAGGRDYDKVYGEGKKYPHYLTGSSSITSVLDAWVKRGRTFDAWWENDGFVFEMHGLEDVDQPRDLRDNVLKTGEKVYWENRGFRYEITRFTFPGGSVGTSMRCLNPVKGISHLMYDFTKTGRGKTFADAMKSAFNADPVEVTKN